MDHNEATQSVTESVAAARRSAPDLMAPFGDLAKLATAEGAISAKSKALITLAMAVSAKSSECVVYHVNNAVRSGVTRDEMAELLIIAAYMGGGPALMAAEDALRHFDAQEGREPA